MPMRSKVRQQVRQPKPVIVMLCQLAKLRWQPPGPVQQSKVLRELKNLSAEAMMRQQHKVYVAKWLMLQLAFAGSLLMDLLQMRWQSSTSSGSEDLTQSLEARVQEFTLSNGLHFIVLERSIAPIVSCHTYADVGAFDEVDGQTGIAHLLEHMAFKGSPRIGTKDYAKEAPILEALDEVFYSMKEAEASGRVALAQKLNDQMQKLEEQAAAFSIPNEFGATLSQAGAAGLNATTSHDATRYFMAMPANKLELWFALEAERFRAPVFRELYSEKRVVFEERRMRVDDSPMGRFQESFAAQAMTNNYRRPVIGYPADLALLGRTEVQSFFNEHYSPQRLSIAVVGDVHVDVVQKLAEKYFGGWQSMSSLPRAGSPSDTEPLPRPEGGPRHFEQGSKAGPLLMQAYYRPSMTSKDAVLLDIIWSDPATIAAL
ncbi:TPA: hypothetical protein ACH3X1_008860 [Trebouxia sp. C0004]